MTPPARNSLKSGPNRTFTASSVCPQRRLTAPRRHLALRLRSTLSSSKKAVFRSRNAAPAPDSLPRPRRPLGWEQAVTKLPIPRYAVTAHCYDNPSRVDHLRVSEIEVRSNSIRLPDLHTYKSVFGPLNPSFCLCCLAEKGFYMLPSCR